MTQYISIEYTDGRVYNQLVYDITPDKVAAIREQKGVKAVKVIGNSR